MKETTNETDTAATTVNEEPKVSTQPTVQTGQEPAQRAPYFEIAEGDDELWYWQLWSGNGRAMAQSAIGYNQMNDAKTAIKTMHQQLRTTAKIVVASK